MVENREDSAPLTNVDEFLRALVVATNNANTQGYHVSLMVSGLIVSGQLVGRDLYFDAIFELLGLPNDDKKEDDRLNLPTVFIHLQNARIFHPSGNPVPGNQGIWWRGRLSAIDGFWFGELRAE